MVSQMKKLISCILILVIICVSCVSCSSKEEAVRNLENPITVLDNEVITIDIISYDTDTGYFTFNITNNTNKIIEFDTSTVVVDKKYSADTMFFTYDLASGTSITESAQFYDAEGYWDLMAGHNFEVTIDVDDDDYNDIGKYTFNINAKDFGVE